MRVPMVLFALSIFALRILTLIPRVIDVDEAWFAASGAALASPFEFFTKALDNKPPGTVWYFWIVDKVLDAGTDPRFGRACALLGLAVAAWLTSLCVERRKRWLAGAVFLMATALPSPKLLATTTEGLMLPLLCFVLWMGSRGLGSKRRLSHAALTGLAFGLCLLLKQTAVFFVPAFAYFLVSAARRRHLSALGVIVACLACVLPVVFTLAKIGSSDFWYWTVVYPADTLSPTRQKLFDQTTELVTHTLVFSLVLWPLIAALRPARWQSQPAAQRRWLAFWLAGGVATVLVGHGLFYHYYLFLVPPLVVLYFSAPGGVARMRMGTRWLGAAYAAVCLLAAVPALGTLWGTDLNYYERLGRYIDGIVHPKDKIFVWSGNALALATSGRTFATRFVTARLAAPPYSNPKSESLFKSDFLTEPPALFVDLHERGDGRFNTPVSMLPWLASELAAHYHAFREPALPWATFYIRTDAASRALASKPGLAVSRFDFNSLYKHVYTVLNEPFDGVSWKTYEFTKRCVRRYGQAVALEELFRDWDGLRVLSELTNEPDEVIEKSYLDLRASCMAKPDQPPGSTDAADLSLARRTRQWLERQFAWRETPLPLSLESPTWWASFAMVKLQPVAWNRAIRTDTPAQRRF